MGRVRSLPRVVQCTHQNGKVFKSKRPGKILSPRSNWESYQFVTLVDFGHPAKRYIHRLVAEAFLDHPRGCDEINHKDGNPRNNRADNLEWVNHSQNMRHALDVIGTARRKPIISDEAVMAIRNSRENYEILADRYGCSPTTIRRIKQRKIHTGVCDGQAHIKID